jgi:dCTP deaminase
MILSQPDIRKAVERGDIVFDPSLEEKQWGEASVDLRLGFQFTKLRAAPGVAVSIAEGLRAIGDLGFWDTKELQEKDKLGNVESYDLRPNEFILALTYESVQVPKNLIARVEGRSTYARTGLSMHQTAPWIQPGWSGPIVLEIANHGPLTIKLTPKIDRPCQLTFFKLTSKLPDTLAYGAKASDTYKDQRHPLNQDKKSGGRK